MPESCDDALERSLPCLSKDYGLSAEMRRDMALILLRDIFFHVYAGRAVSRRR